KNARLFRHPRKLRHELRSLTPRIERKTSFHVSHTGPRPHTFQSRSTHEHAGKRGSSRDSKRHPHPPAVGHAAIVIRRRPPRTKTRHYSSSHWSLAYSALACWSIGMSASAP